MLIKKMGFSDVCFTKLTIAGAKTFPELLNISTSDIIDI
jgi:hypothetical protein